MRLLSLVWRTTLIIALLTGAAIVGAQDAQTPAEICDQAEAPEPETREFEAAEQVIEEGVDYAAIFCTDAGAFYIDLYEEQTPTTVNNFLFLAQNNYYNGTVFHRVIPNFMAQGGDPTASGSGGPGYQFEDEFIPELTFTRPGLLAMANAGPGTNGSQFFVTTVPTPHLNNRHTIFGEVLNGQANVESIEVRDPAQGGDATTLETVVIVTDPEAVTYELGEEATIEEVVAAVDPLVAELPAEVLEITTTDLTSEQVTEEADEAYAAVLEENNHQFRVSNILDNVECDLQNIPFISIGYMLDAFATPDDAAAALESSDITAQLVADGFEAITSEETGVEFYLIETTACEQDAVRGALQWQRQQYIITAEAIIPASDQQAVDLMDQVLTVFVGDQIFEPTFSSIFWRTIR